MHWVIAHAEDRAFVVVISWLVLGEGYEIFFTGLAVPAYYAAVFGN